MALANVAWILASNRRRVLVIDWDLEAPGLHRYFQPFLIDPDLVSTQGMIDYAWDLSLRALTPQDHDDLTEEDWMEKASDLASYAVRLDWDFEGGLLDFIPAGRQGSGYAERVNSFSWLDFYERIGGGKILEAARERMRRDYDFILIDSRTGVGDVSGICTVQMPDVLVACFTPNLQSIEGVAAVLKSVVAQRHRKSLRILPVMTRLELAEKVRMETARGIARETFDVFLEGSSDPRGYWRDAEILHQPYYSYGETLATFSDQAGGRGSETSMLSAMERLARRVASEPRIAMPEIDGARRRKVLASYFYSDVAPVPELQDPALQVLFGSVEESCRDWRRSERNPALLLDDETLLKLGVAASLSDALEADRVLSAYMAESRRASEYRNLARRIFLLPVLSVGAFGLVPDDLKVLGLTTLLWKEIVVAAFLLFVLLAFWGLQKKTGVTIWQGLRILASNVFSLAKNKRRAEKAVKSE